MAKIVFIIPTANSFLKNENPPSGIGYISSYLFAHNHTVSIIDQGITENIPVMEDADIIGITAVTPTIKAAWETLRKIKQKNSKVLTIISGPHVSAIPIESIEKDFVDVVVYGEGEETTNDICNHIDAKKSFHSIPGIFFKEGGNIIENPPRPLIKDLDKLPFPSYDIFPALEEYAKNYQVKRRERSVNILTSRGCPFNCYFCYKGITGRKWRSRSSENVVTEWEYMIKKYHISEFTIQDDCFNSNIDRAKEICASIINKNLVIPWSTPNGIRADLVDLELLQLMKKSGCYHISFGIETGCPVILKKIGKNINFDKYQRAFELAKKAKIKTMAFFIIGHPWDTKETILETINYAKKAKINYAQFTKAMPIPGSRFYKMVQNEGRFLTDSWSGFDHYANNVAFQYKEFNSVDYDDYDTLAYKKFYLRPKKLFSLLFDSHFWSNLHLISKCLLIV